MNRSDFQNLAAERLLDAEALLESGRFDGAYYIAGYAIECALKACIANLTKEDDFPPRETRKIWTHDLELVDRIHRFASGIQTGESKRLRVGGALGDRQGLVRIIPV